MSQIDHSLSTSERERLIKRTRVRRGEGKVVGGGKGLVPLEGEGSGDKGKEIDEECFDDNDFYQQLLREVVESRMLDLGAFPIFFNLSPYRMVLIGGTIKLAQMTRR